MKKGLLSILAGALLVVGCQNYDDQFDRIENSINALNTQVDGLSAVASQLTSLSATVQSLATTVSSLPSSSEIATQISTGLAGIIEDVADLEAAIAAADTSAAVAAIQADIDAQEEVLADLLASSSVFTGDVEVNSAATLDAYLAMGPALSIVNGNVTITVSTAMDQTKVQSLMDNILTIVKDLTYTAAASTIAETTFDNLTGVQSITITQGGGYRFPNLLSATTIDMKDDFESTVGVIHFGSLTTVTAFETDGTANLIQFTKATELHLTSLVYYPGGTLTIQTDEGAAMPFALDDIDGDGDTLEDGLTLNITGPASFSVSNIADGSITLTDVATVNLTGFYGAVTLLGDVNDFTSDSLVSLTTSSTTALETIDVTGALDPDDDDSVGPAIALSSLSDLETAKIAGKVASITVSSNGNLTDLTITATVADAISVSSNSDLTGLTVTGATASGITVSSNSDLATLAIDLTFAAGSATGAVIDGSVDVTDNESLESLTVSSNNIETLTITGNDDLTTLDFTGVTAIGATGEATVNIYDNDLSASKITDADDGTTDVANGASGDLGSITTTSGLDTLATYLAAVAADADSTAAVYFDSVDSFILEDDSETPDAVYSASAASQADAIKVLVLSANTADTGDAATKAKRSFLFPVNATNINSINVNNTSIILNGAKSTMGVAEQTFLDATALSNADAAGVTMTYTLNASPQANITIDNNSSAMENSYTGAAFSATNLNFGVSDSFTLTVDGLAATITYTHVAAAGFVTDAGTIAHALAKKWNDTYVGTASANLVRWTLVTDTAINSAGAGASADIDIIAKDRGSRDVGAAMSATYSLGKTSTDSSVGFLIGNVNNDTKSASDNIAQGSYVMVTFEADTAGDLLGEIGDATDGNVAAAAGAISINATGFVELSSTYAPNTELSDATTATNIFPTQSRLDVILPEEANAAATSNAVSFSRVSWL